MQKPSVGYVVLARVNPLLNNGADYAPALITRVWGPDVINVTVLPDAAYQVMPMTSVKLFATESEARAGEGTGVIAHAAWWLPKA